MRIKSSLIMLSLALAGLLSLSSCDKEPSAPGTGGETLAVTLDVRPSAGPGTRADIPDDPAERKVNRYDLFVFQDGNSSVYSYHSGSNPAQSGENGSFTTDIFRVAAGAYDFIVIANGPGDLRSIGTKEALLAAMSAFSGNSSSSFVMSGSVSSDVAAIVPDGEGVRHVPGLVLERVASKVVLRSVAKDFESPSLQSETVTLLGARLVNVPKEAPCLRPAAGDTSPGEVASAYHNGTSAWESNVLVTARLASPLTVTGGSGVETGIKLYSYPNPAPEAAALEDGDRVTKLVLEIAIGGDVFYYPIGIPQTASACRNLVYDISKVTIRRQGNTGDDPREYLDWRSKAVDVSMTVLDWNEGTVVGVYNSIDMDYVPYNFIGTASGDFTVDILSSSGSVVSSFPVPVSEGAFAVWLPELTGGQRYSFQDRTQINTITRLPDRLRDGPGTLENTFKGCSNLMSLCSFDCSGVTSLLSFFADCSSLTDVPWLDTRDCYIFRGMFIRCSSLQNAPCIDTHNGVDFRTFFKSSGIVALPQFDFTHGWDMCYMLQDCQNLRSVPDLEFPGVGIGEQYLADVIAMFPGYWTTTPDTGHGSVNEMLKGDFSLERVGRIVFGNNISTTRIVHKNQITTDTKGAILAPDGVSSSWTYGRFISWKSDSLTYAGGFEGVIDNLNLSFFTALDRNSLLRIIDGLGVCSGKDIVFNDNCLALLTSAELDIARDKGWRIMRLNTSYYTAHSNSTFGGNTHWYYSVVN